MRNLLPQQHQKKVRREYRLRLSTLALFMVTSVVAMGVVSLLPSLFLSHSKKLSIENQAEFVERSIALREAEVSLATLRDSRARLDFLSSTDERILLTEVTRTLCQCEELPTIALNGFFFEELGNLSKMKVTGIASTREELLSYKNRLERSGIFTSVELPVSNLAQDRDIEFSITVEGIR